MVPSNKVIKNFEKIHQNCHFNIGAGFFSLSKAKNSLVKYLWKFFP